MEACIEVEYHGKSNTSKVIICKLHVLYRGAKLVPRYLGTSDQEVQLCLHGGMRVQLMVMGPTWWSNWSNRAWRGPWTARVHVDSC